MGDRLDPTRRVVPTLIAQYYIPYRNNISLQGVSFIPILLWSLIYLTVTPLSTALAESREPIQLKADRLEYLKEEDLYLAEGSVGVRQGEIRIEADSLRLENTTGILRATGNVHFADGENLADADRAELDVNTKLGVLYNSSLFIKSDNYYLKGKRIERRALDRYELQDGSFTACECEKDPDWQIRARRLRVSLEKFLVARDIVFYANDLPIFYLPYLIYPVKTKRQTGLLVPRLGYSSRHGFRYRQDFFWAIAQNQDATFTFEHKGSKGDGLAIAYRYLLSRNSGGTIKTDYFLDRKDNLGRWEIRYDHQQRLADRIHVKLDARYVNQTNQFQDLSDQTSDRALQEVESNIFLTYRGEESFAYLLARYT
ncbi:MAG: LPS-assembly protein LptD, partial [Nitrospiria bacterium]